MTRTLPSLALAALIALPPLAAPAAALPPLSQNRVVTDGLIAVGMALEIAETCPDLSARTVRGLLYLNELKKAAQAQGYSAAQIDAFVADKEEKAKLEARARALLAERGAVPGDAASHCALGRAEIAAASPTGRLLRD